MNNTCQIRNVDPSLVAQTGVGPEFKLEALLSQQATQLCLSVVSCNSTIPRAPAVFHYHVHVYNAYS